MEKVYKGLNWSNKVEVAVAVALAALAFATPGKEEIGEIHTYLKWLFYGLVVLIYPVRMWFVRVQRKKLSPSQRTVKLPGGIEMGVYPGSWKTKATFAILIGWALYTSFWEVNDFWTGWGAVAIVVVGLLGSVIYDHTRKLMRNKDETNERGFACFYPLTSRLTISPVKYAVSWILVLGAFLSIAFFFDYMHKFRPFGPPGSTGRTCPLDNSPTVQIEKK